MGTVSVREGDGALIVEKTDGTTKSILPGTAGALKRLDVIVTAPQFTDGGAAAGTYQFPADKQLPAGAIVLETKVETQSPFTGDTSAVAIVGILGGDDDQFLETAVSCFTANTAYGIPATWPTDNFVSAATTALGVTVTTATDFTIVFTGSGRLRISIFYIDGSAT